MDEGIGMDDIHNQTFYIRMFLFFLGRGGGKVLETVGVRVWVRLRVELNTKNWHIRY